MVLELPLPLTCNDREPGDSYITRLIHNLVFKERSHGT
jgi:hypothetical protein